MTPDWQAIEHGLRQWVIDMTGIRAHHVAWDRAPVEYREYVQVDLRLFDHRARQGMGAEIVYPDASDAGVITPVAVSQRACTWSVTVTTRDQRANHKAYVVLDQLAVMLELPYSRDVFAALGLSTNGTMLIVSDNPPSEHRDLSQATLRVEIGYVAAVSAPVDTLPGSAVSIIEHAEVSGVAINVAEPIVIPPAMLPPLPPPTP